MLFIIHIQFLIAAVIMHHVFLFNLFQLIMVRCIASGVVIVIVVVDDGVGLTVLLLCFVLDDALIQLFMCEAIQLFMYDATPFNAFLIGGCTIDKLHRSVEDTEAMIK